MKEFFERYPDGKIGDIRTHGYLWFRIKSLLKIMIVLAVFYLFMYLKYDLTNPVDIIKKIGEWLKSILF